MITFQQRFISLGELWFDETPEESGVDIVRCLQRSEPPENIRYTEFYTIVIDLAQVSEALLADMAKTNRYEIRRAEARDNLVYIYYDMSTLEVTSEFCDYYDSFALQKGLEKLDRFRLFKYADYRKLNLSQIKTADDKTLVWHAYYISPNRVRLLNSASHFRESDNSEFRNLVGRANRYHHWRDMLQFKANSVATYDLGGWYNGREDADKLRINQFKEQFGGKIVKNFSFDYGVTLKGKLYLQMRRMGILHGIGKLIQLLSRKQLYAL